MPPPPSARVVLFLQGPPSGFWAELAAAVEARGVSVRRVNLCLADRLFWRRPGAVDYRGTLRQWRHWLREHLAREGVTDIVYYADRLPYHRLAAAVARRAGIGAHAVEFGYLRPNWLTLERGGNGAQSYFPDDPAAMRGDWPAPDLSQRFGHHFAREALGEVSFNLALSFGRPLYPGYVSDKPVHPVVDYLWWLRRLARSRAAARHAAAVQARLLAGPARYWLVGLQLPVDYQLRHSAWYQRQADMVAAVIASFAAHADPCDRLLFKVHPLDNGSTDWAALISARAAAAGLVGRVDCIDGGDLGTLIGGARGVVVANSTVGLTALRRGCPVKVLGAAVYAMPGLTDNRPLDAFWTDPQPPDRALLDAFIARLAAEIQVQGSFYDRAGRAAAAAAMADRLVTGTVGPTGAARHPVRARALRAMRRALAAGTARP